MENIDFSKLFENDQIIWLEEDKLKSEEGMVMSEKGIVKSEEGMVKREEVLSFDEKLLIFHSENGDFHSLFNKILSANPLNLSEKDWKLISQKELSYQDYVRKTKDNEKFILVMGIKENLSSKIQVNQVMNLRNKRFLFVNNTINPIKENSISREEKLSFWEKIKELLTTTNL
ncbi:MAG: hypothetical protein RIR51_1625 [Bacteroidota bacterium]|jgi:hypothetical protein